MNRHHRRRITIRIVVILLVGLAFLIARFVHAQQPTAAELAKKETVASAFTRGFGYPGTRKNIMSDVDLHLLWSCPNTTTLLPRGNSRVRSSIDPSLALLQRYRSMR